MKYILKDGYIDEITFGATIECKNQTCIEYTGTIPSNYSSLEEWVIGEDGKLNAWKIVDGNLAFDSAKYSTLQTQYEQEEKDNSYITHKELGTVKIEQDENLKELYDEQSIENSSVTRLNTIDNTSNLNVEKVDIRANSGITDSIKLFLTNGNMLPNELIDGVSDGVTFRPNDDRSIDISSSIHNVASGKNIHLENTTNHDVNSISLKGRSTQDGTPTPDSPIPIENITEISATVTGKNLINPNLPVNSKTQNGITITNNGDGTYTATGTSTSSLAISLTQKNTIKLNKSTSYTNSIEILEGNFLGAIAVAVLDSEDKITYNYINVSSSSLSNTKTPTEDLTIKTYEYYIDKANITVNFKFRVQLEEGTVATEYEEYKSNSLTIDLQGNELCSLPDGTKDEINIVNGEALLVKRIGKVILDGTQAFYRSNELTNSYRYHTAEIIRGFNNISLSNYFVNKTIGNINSVDEPGLTIVNNRQLAMRVNKNIASTVDEFKTWLSTHNVEVLYKLAEPKTINLGTVEMPHTYDSISNVSNSENTDMEVEYYTKNVEYNLAGTSSNVESIMYFIANENYYLNGLIKDVSIRFYDFDGTDRTLIGEYYDKDSINFSEDKKVTQITLNVAVGMPIEKTIYPMLQTADQLDIDSGELKQYMAYKANVLNVNLNNSNIEFVPGDQLIIEKGKAEIIKERFLYDGEILYTSSDGEINLYFQFPEELYKSLPSEETIIAQFGIANPKIYISDKKIYLEYINSDGTTETISLYDKENNINLTKYVMNLGSTEHITATSVNYNSGALDYISSKKFDTWKTITLNNLTMPNIITMPTTYYRTTNIYTDKIALTSIQYRNIEKMNTQKVKIGTFEIFEDRLLSDIIPKLDFTESDITKVRNYITGSGTLTYTEKLLYDLNEDGVVNAKDLLIMNKMIKCNVTTTEHGTLEINSKDPQKTILLKDKAGNEVVNLSMLGITTPSLKVGNSYYGENQHSLWSGAFFMNGNQTITLSEKISEQVNGIVLVFSEYNNGSAQDYNFSCHFVPKEFVSLWPDYGSSFFLNNSKLGLVGSKYLYIKDDEISGNAANEETGTGTSGIKYTNNRFVLREVIGV